MFLTAQNIHKSYRKKNTETVILSGAFLEVDKGEFIAITGPSGIGKSTLLHILGILDSPDKGEVKYSLNGNEINPLQLPTDELALFRNKHVGFVFQFHHLLPEFTALENVMIPAMIGGAGSSKAKSAAMELLEETGVANRAGNKPSELSGGEQQRIAIARAMINQPDLILADEPTGNLDKENAESFLNLIADMISKRQTTVIIATHSERVSSLAGRILRINDGILKSAGE